MEEKLVVGAGLSGLVAAINLSLRTARAVSRGRVVVVDASTGRLERLRQNCDNIGASNVENVAARLERLPLDSVTFDAALCRSALWHGKSKGLCPLGFGRKDKGRVFVYVYLGSEATVTERSVG